MARPKPTAVLGNGTTGKSGKRKGAPSDGHQPQPNKRQKTGVDHKARQRDARALATQTASKAFQNGALDVDKFVKAREFEMHALEQGMQRSKKALNRRAFQQVPTELRRRTASHNVKRVPKSLRDRAKKEVGPGPEETALVWSSLTLWVDG